ncbi:MAG TPA: DUF2961 domain-containing protein, partial [Verrucomicrobia bacterium]|nr:DUF2961 domain-containing protein [Verrucomicrobiota bacterium]
MNNVMIWAICGTLILTVPGMAVQPVSLESLLDEMVNRDHLAQLPAVSYTCSQASSYDRGSVAPDQPGWFANMDRSW